MGLLRALGISTGKEKKLVENGIKIEAVIVRMDYNTAVSINGRNPMKLICDGCLPNGLSKLFESGNVSPMTHPEVIGKTINVYVDPENYDRYYVDAQAYK